MRISDWSSDVCSSDLSRCSLLALPQPTPPSCEGARCARVIGSAHVREPHLVAHRLSGVFAQQTAPSGRSSSLDGRPSDERSTMTRPDTPQMLRDLMHGDVPFALLARDASTVEVLTGDVVDEPLLADLRSEEHTSELQSLMRISYAVFCLQK